MKKLFVLLSFILASHLLLAGNIQVFNSGTTFKVVYTSPQVCNTRITIVDSYGTKIFSEVIYDQCGFIRPYNFSKLPYGDYTIIASNEFEKQSKKVSHYEKKEVELPFHVTRLNDDKYVLGVPSAGQEKIVVSVFGKQAGLLYSATIKIKGDYACLYKLKDMLPSEEISFRVTTTK